MELFDKIKEEVRESVEGTNPENDLLARLHVDHLTVSTLIEALKETESHEVVRREDLRRQLIIGLTAHSRAEEEVVYPELTRHEALRDLGERSLLEHGRLDRALEDLRVVRAVDPTFVARVEVLDDILREHVHDEESTVLPRAEAVIGREELAKLIPAFEQRCGEWRTRLVGERRGRKAA